MGAAPGRALRRVRRYRRGLRLPDRDGAVRPRADRLGDAVDLRPADHKQRMEEFRFTGTFISLTRDRGAGQVTVDANGEAVPMYSVTDPLDLENLKHGDRGAGPPARGRRRPPDRPAGRGGADLAAGRRPRGVHRRRQADPVPRRRLQAVQRPPDGHLPHGRGSRRPRSPGPWGELHDTKGVWIGDGSAFPTSSGTNPMVSIMALAHRTAEAIADDAGAKATDSAAARSADPPDQLRLPMSSMRGARLGYRDRSPSAGANIPPRRSSATASTSAASGWSPPGPGRSR